MCVTVEYTAYIDDQMSVTYRLACIVKTKEEDFRVLVQQPFEDIRSVPFHRNNFEQERKDRLSGDDIPSCARTSQNQLRMNIGVAMGENGMEWRRVLSDEPTYAEHNA